MSIRPVALLVPVLGVLLGLLLPFEPAVPAPRKSKHASPPEVGGVWSDARFLDKHLKEACEVVQQATGAKYVTMPGVRVGDALAVADVLRVDWGDVMRKLGAADEAQVAAMCSGMAANVVSVYDPASNAILVVPANAVRAADAAQDPAMKGRDVLRLLLVRMAVVAQDRQLFPEWKQALEAAATPEAIHCAGAVLEGHAQVIAERVAEHWEILDAYPLLVKLLTAPPAESEASAASAPLEAEVKFAIVTGHAFMQAVTKKRGRGGVVKLLKEPPAERSVIESPATFLRPKPRPSQSPEKALEELAALAGEGWTKTSTALGKEEVEGMLAPLKPSECATVMAAYEGGTTLVAEHAERKTTLKATLLEFRSDGLAEAFVNMLKGVTRDAKLQDGAGRDSGLLGFSGTRKTTVGDEERTESMQWVNEGRFVIGIVTDDQEIDRESQDDALEASSENLRKRNARRPR